MYYCIILYVLLFLQKTEYCQKYEWDKVKLGPNHINNMTLPISSVVAPNKPVIRLPIVTPQPAMVPVTTPCKQGIEYWCFSMATAKHCKYVSNLHLLCCKFTTLTYFIFRRNAKRLFTLVTINCFLCKVMFKNIFYLNRTE